MLSATKNRSDPKSAISSPDLGSLIWDFFSVRFSCPLHACASCRARSSIHVAPSQLRTAQMAAQVAAQLAACCVMLSGLLRGDVLDEEVQANGLLVLLASNVYRVVFRAEG